MNKTLKAVIIAGGLLIILGTGAFLAGNLQKSGVKDLPLALEKDFGSRAQMGTGVANTSDFSAPEMAVPGSEMMSQEDGISDIPSDKKIIKSGNLNLKVESADKALEEITQVAKNNQGEIFSSEITQSANGQTKNGYITVKVPVAKFETAFGELKKVASLVLVESTSGQDVTEQYADLQSRLKNKQAEEASFLKILEQSAEVDDVLKVTRELYRVRGEIEVLQGRIKLMDSQTDMSTIVISLTEDADITVIDSWRPWQVIKNSVNSLVKSLQGFIDFVIKLAIIIVPVLLIYGIFVWILYKIGRGIYRRFKNRNKIEAEK